MLALPEDEQTATIQLHLAHAVALNPELERSFGFVGCYPSISRRAQPSG